ncbi:MAG: D-alanyl-D-alanine carboxypeptidase [bacterium]|nr:D-alanyl-D-alanine carboxypeptidase [bacterium]
MPKHLSKAALVAAAFAIALPAAAREEIPDRTGDPYLGAIVLEAETGEVVFEENADAECYPASIVKLMTFLIVRERIDSGTLGAGDPVRVTAEAARMGGSQVYLKEGETFPVEELLAALMVQSANDAAVALAVHVAGSTEAFTGLMNRRAADLGMERTVFHTVHGLPPARGQRPDVSTPREIAVLSLEALRHPAVLALTSVAERGFRDGAFLMRSHNRLLRTFEGCDGLKTGYFRLGGYSVAATASRGGRRLVAVVAGARERPARDRKAAELLLAAFGKAPPRPAPTPTPVPVAVEEKPVRRTGLIAAAAIALALAVSTALLLWRRRLRGPPPLPGPRFGLK